MPEWQGAGVGTKFLNYVCEYHIQGRGRCGKEYPTFFHTSHPQLCGYLRNAKGWRQTNAAFYGANKTKSYQSIQRSTKAPIGKKIGTGYGGHFRAVQSFKYSGKENESIYIRTKEIRGGSAALMHQQRV